MSDKYTARNRQRSLIVLLIITLAFIWGNSVLSGDVSSKISNSLTQLICSFWKGFGESGTASDGCLRKFAHAFEFACLGTELILLIRFNIKKYISSAVLFGLSTALIDETIQLFSEGRGSQVKDIWIDMLGFFIGTFIVLSFLRFIRNKRDRELFDATLSVNRGDDESGK